MIEKRMFYVLYYDDDGNEESITIRAENENLARSFVSHFALIAVVDLGEDGEYEDIDVGEL